MPLPSEKQSIKPRAVDKQTSSHRLQTTISSQVLPVHTNCAQLEHAVLLPPFYLYVHRPVRGYDEGSGNCTRSMSVSPFSLSDRILAEVLT